MRLLRMQCHCASAAAAACSLLPVNSLGQQRVLYSAAAIASVALQQLQLLLHVLQLLLRADELALLLQK